MSLMFDNDPTLMPEAAARGSGAVVRFYSKPVKDEEASAKEGRPIYRPREYVEIRTPGDRSSVVDRPAKDVDRAAYPQHYARFKAGDKEQVVGTPLEKWPAISTEQVLELQHFNCRTVEQLASMTDANLGNVGPLRRLREQAQAWLEAAQGLAPVSRLTAELEQERSRRSALEQQVTDLAKQVEALSKKKG